MLASMKFPTIACLLLAGSAHAAPLTSHFPEHGLGLFLRDKFDLASIRSSFGPRRQPEQRTFADFGMVPSKADDDTLVFDLPGDWYYELKILGRRDVNRDGIEDLLVCLVDRAQNGGTYHTATALLVTRYAPDGFAIALSYSLNDKRCPPSPAVDR